MDDIMAMKAMGMNERAQGHYLVRERRHFYQGVAELQRERAIL
jgi:hypothetical protein